MQINLIGALIFALIVAIFSVNNPGPVPVNFLVWGFEAPLVLVILGSAAIGAIVVFLLGMVKQFSLIRRVRVLEAEKKDLEKKLNEISVKEEDIENQEEKATETEEKKENEVVSS